MHGVGSKLGSSEIPSLGFSLTVGIRGRFSMKAWKKDQGGLRQEGFRSSADSDLVLSTIITSGIFSGFLNLCCV